RRRHTRSKRDWSSDVCSSDMLRGCHKGNLLLLGKKEIKNWNSNRTCSSTIFYCVYNICHECPMFCIRDYVPRLLLCFFDCFVEMSLYVRHARAYFVVYLIQFLHVRFLHLLNSFYRLVVALFHFLVSFYQNRLQIIGVFLHNCSLLLHGCSRVAHEFVCL